MGLPFALVIAFFSAASVHTDTFVVEDARRCDPA
jgi:hypothetical protein